jgi:Ribbon-helix-helix protein
MMKDSGLRIRVQRDLRDRFLEVCRTQDRPAAQVIREFMRDYVENNGQLPGPPAKHPPRDAADAKDAG